MTRALLAMAILTVLTPAAALPPQLDAAAIQHELDELGVVGTVLYVAAHPDDENTRLLAWLANERKVRAVYLSLTRGDGGQNLIGEEQDALFGLIRTRELLEARRIDGAEQLFTRARDFGYSKTADETLALWGRDEILADVVLAIRRVRPDVIITRFPAEGPPNHGHHTASAILANEAFAAAADPARFPAQLTGPDAVQPWQARRLLWNVSSWNMPPDVDKSKWLEVDVGSYSPLLGASMGELAGRSRSMHKSQGFGAPQQRGTILEYFEHVAGDPAQGDLLDGVDLTWGRVPGAGPLAERLEAARAAYDPRAPHRSVAALLEARDLAGALAPSPWREHTLRRLDALIVAGAGLHLEATADRVGGSPGDPLPVTIEATNRSPVPLTLAAVVLPDGTRVPLDAPLSADVPLTRRLDSTIPAGAPSSGPYWLQAPADGARFTVTDRTLLGLPVAPPDLPVTFELRSGAHALTQVRGVAYKWVDPVQGEQRRDFEVGPPATIAFEREALVFPGHTARPVRVTVRAGRPDIQGTVRLELPSGWAASPPSSPVALAKEGDEETLVFTVSPPRGGGSVSGAGTSPLARAVVEVGGRPYSESLVHIDYPHIPIQAVHRPASVPVVAFPLTRAGDRVGYVEGPGDKVADALRDMGYTVDVLSDETLSRGDLSPWSAIVVGVRAFSNTPRIAVWQPRLLRWVEQGGTLVVQYATKNHLSDLLAPIGPRALAIGRGRVTDETAPVTPLAPESPILTRPNRLGPGDWDGWVQERGLYFAEKWDPAWTPVLSLADPGEPAQEGALLAMDHGKGRVVYTGLALFRQLPAGVPGAFRLLANLVDHAR